MIYNIYKYLQNSCRPGWSANRWPAVEPELLDELALSAFSKCCKTFTWFDIHGFFWITRLLHIFTASHQTIEQWWSKGRTITILVQIDGSHYKQKTKIGWTDACHRHTFDWSLCWRILLHDFMMIFFESMYIQEFLICGGCFWKCSKWPKKVAHDTCTKQCFWDPSSHIPIVKS